MFSPSSTNCPPAATRTASRLWHSRPGEVVAARALTEVEVASIEGELWITTGSDSLDYSLRAGEHLRLVEAAHLVVQSMGPAKWTLTHARAAAPCDEAAQQRESLAARLAARVGLELAL